MLLASAHEPIYNSAVFWSVVTLIVIILVGVGTVLFPYLFGSRRGQFIYGVELSAPLVSNLGRQLSNLKVTLGDVPLVNPRTVTLRAENRSRRDIGSDDFNDQNPVILDVGSTIIGMGFSSRPVHPRPEIKVNGSQVQIGPCKIARAQIIRVTVLVDGPDRRVTCESPLLQVDEREQDFAPTPPRRNWRPVAALAAVAASFAAFIAAIATATNGPHGAVTFSGWTALLITVPLAAAVGVLMLLATPARRLPIARRPRRR